MFPTMDENESEILQGRKGTREELFYESWGWESLKGNLAFVNQSLRELVILNTALLGGGVVILDRATMGHAFRLVVLACILGSLIASLWGALPREWRVDLRIPAMIRAEKLGALAAKMRILRVAAVLLVAGFAVAIVGLWVGK